MGRHNRAIRDSRTGQLLGSRPNPNAVIPPTAQPLRGEQLSPEDSASNTSGGDYRLSAAGSSTMLNSAFARTSATDKADSLAEAARAAAPDNVTIKVADAPVGRIVRFIGPYDDGCSVWFNDKTKQYETETVYSTVTTPFVQPGDPRYEWDECYDYSTFATEQDAIEYGLAIAEHGFESASAQRLYKTSYESGDSDVLSGWLPENEEPPF